MKPNKTIRDRHARLMPAGVPRYIRCYDNSGKSIDRYTVYFIGRAMHGQTSSRTLRSFVAMSGAPFHPQGFGQHGEGKLGAHNGKRISFADLPADCRKLVMQDYCAAWNIPLPAEYLSEFARAYLVAALWTEDEDAGSGDFEVNGRPDELWHLFAPETVSGAIACCEYFATSNAEALRASGLSDDQAGHDLWLTRNGHGSGFWDREGDKDALKTLTDAAHALGDCDLYPGDDGRLYFSK